MWISSLALLGLVAEQGHAVPGAVGGDVAEGVAVEAGLPLTGQGEVGGQIADGVGSLRATTVAAQGDDEAPRFEDVDIGMAMGGVGVGAQRRVCQERMRTSGSRSVRVSRKAGSGPSSSPWSYQARTAEGSGSQWSIMVLAPNLR